LSTPPDQIWLYHITHVDNLAAIVQAGGLRSDAQMRQGHVTPKIIGYDHIKDRRLGLPVGCHAGTTVGEYVPFYFCPRSAMLYVISKGNNDLTYKEGQESIVHLVANMYDVVDWAVKQQVRWAFSTSNAGSKLADFFNDLGELKEINWDAVNAHQWRECREEKQAEFLVQQTFPLALFRYAATMSDNIRCKANQFFSQMDNPPIVTVQRDWYY